jgi:protein sidekick
MEVIPQNLTVLDGKDATLNCRAIAAPVPNVTWFYNGEYSQFSFKCFFSKMFGS